MKPRPASRSLSVIAFCSLFALAGAVGCVSPVHDGAAELDVATDGTLGDVHPVPPLDRDSQLSQSYAVTCGTSGKLTVAATATIIGIQMPPIEVQSGTSVRDAVQEMAQKVANNLWLLVKGERVEGAVWRQSEPDILELELNAPEIQVESGERLPMGFFLHNDAFDLLGDDLKIQLSAVETSCPIVQRTTYRSGD